MAGLAIFLFVTVQCSGYKRLKIREGNRMIMLELSRASFDCLLDHASEALPELFKQQAKDDESGYVSLGSQVNILCTEEQAKELLAIAEKDCTGAISAIKTGIRLGNEDRLAEKKS